MMFLGLILTNRPWTKALGDLIPSNFLKVRFLTLRRLLIPKREKIIAMCTPYVHVVLDFCKLNIEEFTINKLLKRH